MKSGDELGVRGPGVWCRQSLLQAVTILGSRQRSDLRAGGEWQKEIVISRILFLQCDPCHQPVGHLRECVVSCERPQVVACCIITLLCLAEGSSHHMPSQHHSTSHSTSHTPPGRTRPLSHRACPSSVFCLLFLFAGVARRGGSQTTDPSLRTTTKSSQGRISTTESSCRGNWPTLTHSVTVKLLVNIFVTLVRDQIEQDRMSGTFTWFIVLIRLIIFMHSYVQV